MGVAIEHLYICDGCDDTISCGSGSLVSKWKWRRWNGRYTTSSGKNGRSWELLLCPDCQPEK